MSGSGLSGSGLPCVLRIDNPVGKAPPDRNQELGQKL